MRTLSAWKIADALVIALIARVIGLLISWSIGVVAFLIGQAAVLHSNGKGPMPSYKKRAMEGRESAEWLEEWHDDMRRWQIGPYEWRD